MSENQDLLKRLEEDLIEEGSLPPALRKAMILGGRIGSPLLRDWAKQELDGYDTGPDDLPKYRRVPSAIQVDVQIGPSYTKGQTISPTVLPEYARDLFMEGAPFFQGAATVEALAQSTSEEGGMRFAHARALDVAADMDKRSGNPFQHINALYWWVPHSGIVGIVDAIRNNLVGIIAELVDTADAPDTLPSGPDVDDVVRRIVQAGSRSSRT